MHENLNIDHGRDRQVPSWRSQIEVHPLILKVIPPRTQRQRETLQASVAAYGIQVRPVLIEEGGKVYLFDGCGRLDAAEAAGAQIIYKNRTFEVVKPAGAVTNVPIPDVIVRSSDTDILGLALSHNRHAREWTTGMKAALVAEIIKFNPTLSALKIAQITGTSHPFARKIRDQLEESGDVERVSTSIDRLGRRHSRTKPKKVKSVSTAAPNAVTPVVTEAHIAAGAPESTVSAPTYPAAPSKASVEVALRKQIYNMVETAREALALAQNLTPSNRDGIREKLGKIIKTGTGEAEKPAPKSALKTTTFDETLYGKAMGYAPIGDPGAIPGFLDRNARKH
jgi:hypothetical protein